MTDVTVSRAGHPAGARTHARSSLARQLMVGASVGVLASLLPSIAFAQAVPAGCLPTPATAGDTIDCVVAAPGTIDGISTTVDDLTINIGSLVTATAVEALAGNGVSMTGADGLELNVTGAASSISGSAYGVYMTQTGGADDLSLVSAGSIYGGTGGIYASSAAGSVEIDVAAVDTAGDTAIYGTAAVDLSITANGPVTANTAGSAGIAARGTGTGSITIEAGDVSASGAGLSIFSAGIVAYAVSGTDVSITSSGAVSGSNTGILAFTTVTGAVSIETVDATGDTYLGIGAFNFGYGTDLTVTASGTVTGHQAGIVAVNYGSGTTSIDAGIVTSTVAEGIYATNSAAGTDVSVTASGLVSGGDYGIYAQNYGTGSLTIDAAAVTGATEDGIYAYNSAAGTDLSITASGAVSGGVFGVYAVNLGSGAFDITTAAATGTDEVGIFAYNSGAGTDLSITASGAVTGGVFGMYVTNEGTGATTIEAGAVSGNTVDGIDVQNSATGTSLTVTTTGLVTGVHDGIDADAYGTGSLTINAAAITAGRDGIEAVNSANGTDLIITANGTITAGYNGVYARNYGTGALSITTAAVSGTGAGYDGIVARNSAAGTDLTITASGAVSGGNFGIYARNLGTGDLTIDAAAVTGLGSVGVDAMNTAAGDSISVTTTGLVTGASDGINVDNYGSGELTIHADAVTAGYYGIWATNSAAGTDLTITANGTVSGRSGVRATNSGTGALSVTTAAVTGTSRDGIYVTNTASGTDLTITANGAVEGFRNGIRAVNNGTGALTVSTAGVTGVAAGYGSYSAIRVRNSAAGTDLTLMTSGAVTGASVGIDARNYGTGALGIVTAAVTGLDGNGILATNFAAGTDFTLTASGTITGDYNGILARNFGTGAMSITTTAVTGAGGEGIFAANYAGTDLTVIASGAVTGWHSGIAARNTGTGATAITTTSVTSATGDGIFAYAAPTATDLAISASGAIAGARYGIVAQNFGSGALTIDVASVSGSSGAGVLATNDGAGDLSITATGTVSGGAYGMEVSANGGHLSLNVADVTGLAASGIRAYSTAGTLSSSITSSGLVSGAQLGIYASHAGAGALSISVVDATGGTGAGILARGRSATTDMTIEAAGTVSGGNVGLTASHYGSGALSIAVADVNSTGGRAMSVYNFYGSTGLSVTSTGTLSGVAGLYARNAGTGATVIDLTAATGSGDVAVRVLGGRYSGDISVTTRGSVSGVGNGIQVQNDGSGALSVTATDVTATATAGYATENGTAVLVLNRGADVSVAASGSVAGDYSGIRVYNLGTGAVTVSADEVSGTTRYGIFASNDSSGTDVSITATGAVSGGGIGVRANNFGTGATTINVASATGAGSHGLYVNSSTNTTDLSITASDSVSGGNYGITALFSGSGALTVDVADATGTSEAGIFLQSTRGTGISLNASDTVTGGNTGITANNFGYGAVSLDVVDVSGAGYAGIATYNGAYGTDISVTASGSVFGATDGIRATSAGSGVITIDVADVTGGSGAGIHARTHTGTGSGLAITASGAVYGAGTGINAGLFGTGALAINVTSVTGENETGIEAVLGTAGTDLSITASGSVSGNYYGVSAISGGSGLVRLDLADVSGHYYAGVYVSHAGATGGIDLDISGTASGTRGVEIRSAGAGAIAVDVVDVTGLDSFGILINAQAASSVSLTSTGLVTGASSGVVVTNAGTGALDVNLVDVTGEGGSGVYVSSGAASTDMTMTASGAVSGLTSGVRASSVGSGAMTLDLGTVRGASGEGISANNSSYGASLSITASGDVSGATGIQARQYGSGALTLDLASVVGTNGRGISAMTGGSATDMSVAASGSVTGTTGVSVSHVGSGAVTLDLADVTGTTGSAISAENRTGTDFNISASGSVYGAYQGVEAINLGTGSLTITVADVTGTGSYGIYAYGYATGTGISISSSGTVAGATSGINAANFGGGDVIIDAVDVTGSAYSGIVATGAENSAGIAITASGTVIGGTDGVVASSWGSGTVSLDLADVIGTAGRGISVFSVDGTGINVSVSGSVIAGSDGISLNNGGTGDLVLSAGAVTTGTGFGVNAYSGSRASDTSLTLAGDVTSVGTGIRLWSVGRGVNSIMAGNVTSYGGTGISAYAGVNSSGLSVTTTGVVQADSTGISAYGRSATGSVLIDARGAVTGGLIGIGGFAAGSDGLTIHAADDVTGTGAIGIHANARDLAGELVITAAGDVSGGNVGIYAFNTGTGATTISVAGDVINLGTSNSTTNYGVFAYNAGRATDLSVTVAGSVQGGSAGGVVAFQFGYGAVDINVADVDSTGGPAILAFSGSFTNASPISVTATGDINGGGGGIVAVNNGVGGAVSVTTGGDVTSGEYGIFARTAGGELTLDLGGNVTGGSVGLWVVTEQGQAIEVRSDQTISGGDYGILTGLLTGTGQVNAADEITVFGTVNGAINTVRGDDIVTLAAGSVVNGAVFLDEGDDTLNWQGGALAGARGGGGTDTLNFGANGVRITNSGHDADFFSGFEVYNFLTGGYVLAGAHDGLFETNFLVGDHYLLGSLQSLETLIGAGASLHVANGAAITGNLTNDGDLGINGGGLGTLTVEGDFTQSASGNLTLDRFTGNRADRIDVSGDVALAGTLTLHQHTSYGAPVTLINGGTGLSGGFDTVTGLLTARPLVSQAIVFDADTFDVNLVTVFADATMIAGLTPNQAAIGNGLGVELGSLDELGAFADFGFSLAAIDNVPELAAAFDEMSPEILDPGTQIARNAQFQFLSGLLDVTGGRPADAGPVQLASLDPHIPAAARAPQGPRVWGSLQLDGYSQDGGGTGFGYSTDGMEISAGVADLHSGPVSFGFAVGYANFQTDLAGPDADHARTEVYRYGAFARYDINPDAQGLQARLDGGIALARGTQAVTMDVTIPAAGTSVRQTGDTHFNMNSAMMRLTVDGYDGHSWTIRPLALVSADRYDQNEIVIGSGELTAVLTDGFAMDRVTYGWGAAFEHQWGSGAALNLSLTSLHHTGDTSSQTVSHFAAPGATGLADIGITGRGIEDQILLQGDLRGELAGGYSVSLHGFAQTGDLDGMGGQIRVARRF